MCLPLAVLGSTASAAGATSWSGWQPLSGVWLTNEQGGTPVTYAPGTHGSLQELFMPGPQGAVLMNYELPSGVWNGWHPISPLGFIGPSESDLPITVAPGSNGSVQELFTSGPQNEVWIDYESPPRSLPAPLPWPPAATDR
jgi:hypothetical protein